MEEGTHSEEGRTNIISRKAGKVVKYIVLINVLVFAAQLTFPEYLHYNLTEKFALYHYQSENFAIYQFITYMFLHAGFFHIFLNMFILWMFGTSLEYIWNSRKFLFYYFFTGIGAALLHMSISTYSIDQLEKEIHQYANNPGLSDFTNLVTEEIGDLPENIAIREPVLKEIIELRTAWRENPEDPQYKPESVRLMYQYLDFYIDRPSLGASGAVFGILLAFGMIFPNVLVYLYFLFPIKAKYFVIFLGILELYFGVFGEQVTVANFAHLGGMIFGFILLKIWGERPRRVQT